MLADMLAFFDKLHLYDRSIAHPFLLLDGHHSRISLPFLQYVNSENHNGSVVLASLVPPMSGRGEMQVL
jgi:hypothetical protein